MTEPTSTLVDMKAVKVIHTCYCGEPLTAIEANVSMLLEDLLYPENIGKTKHICDTCKTTYFLIHPTGSTFSIEKK